MNTSSHTPLLIFVRGIPGSGKSYFTYALRDAIKDTDITVIDPDFIDKTDNRYIEFANSLVREGLDPSIIPFRWLRKSTIDAAHKNTIIIWNQPFTNKGVFDRLIAYLKEEIRTVHGHELRVLVIEVHTPKEVAWNRVQQRVKEGGHGPSRDTFDARCSEYVSYADFYQVLELNGEQDSSHLVDTTLKWIQSATL